MPASSGSSLAPVATVDGEVAVNEYFATHPEMILGELRRVNGQYGADDIDVIADPAKTIAPAMAAIVARARDGGLTYEPRPETGSGRRSECRSSWQPVDGPIWPHA